MRAPAHSGPIEFAVNHWPVPIVEPTTLIAYVPGDAPPNRDQVVKLLQSRGVTIIADGEVPKEPRLHWHVSLQLADAAQPIQCWCEANDDHTKLGDRALDACQWILGLQSPLKAADPAGSYNDFIQLLLAAAPDAPAIFDANTGLCHGRDSIKQLMIDDAPPATDWLWRVDAIAAPVARTNTTKLDAPLWLRTVGLNRCARPELEMINVPRDLADAAVTLLNILADHFIDQSPPPPGLPFEIGPDMNLSLQPVVEFLHGADARDFGSLDQRSALGVADDAPAAFIVDATTTAAQSSNCPATILQQITDGSAPLFLSERATARQAALARRQWPHAVEMYHSQQSSASRSRNRFFVKAAIDASAGGTIGTAREHIWFEILSIENRKARARSLHPSAAASISTEDEFAIDPAGITDWRIETPDGAVGPNDILRAGDAEASAPSGNAASVS